MRLTLNELLDLGCMQTDPNWANFLYNPRTRKVTSLIDLLCYLRVLRNNGAIILLQYWVHT